eukprot:snap_masked-scaffold_1-processed-gene-22.24-mRNA-1 protein AED:1.00 eAED:1.00 QI:0/-1/0/0/-1/1/1/0/73
MYWDQLYRWTIRLQSVDFTASHIPSRDNFVINLLTSWAVNSAPQFPRVSGFLGTNLAFDEDGDHELILRADWS